MPLFSPSPSTTNLDTLLLFLQRSQQISQNAYLLCEYLTYSLETYTSTQCRIQCRIQSDEDNASASASASAANPASSFAIQDILTGDEIISDSYDLKEVDGIAYEADCAMIEEGAVNVDIGANASAEEQDEALEDTSVKVNNIVHSFRLQSTQFDKKGYLVYLKGMFISPFYATLGAHALARAYHHTTPFIPYTNTNPPTTGYMKAVKAALQEQGKSAEEIKDFETKAGAFAKNVILAKFKDWEFYTGESMNPDGMVVLLNYREDGTTPYVVVWKHGLKETKV